MLLKSFGFEVALEDEPSIRLESNKFVLLLLIDPNGLPIGCCCSCCFFNEKPVFKLLIKIVFVSSLCDSFSV